MKFFFNKIKYKHIFLSLISIILFFSLIVLLANAFLNHKLNKSNISLNNISESIRDVISSNFDGTEVKIDSIELTKLEDGKIYLYIKNVTINDELGRELIRAPSILIENGLISYLMGSLSQFYLEKITQRSIKLIRPNISLYQEKTGEFNFYNNSSKDREIILSSQNSNSIDNLEENINYHFYQSYLQYLYSLVSVSDNSFYSKYFKSIKKLDVKDASIVIFNNKNEEIHRINNAALNFNNNDNSVLINLNITSESIVDDNWFIDVNLLRNIDSIYTNIDLTFKNISNQNTEINYLNFLNSVRTPLSGRINFDITELGMVNSLKSDINIGADKLHLDNSNTKDYESNVSEHISIKDGYLSFEYKSSSNEVLISDIRIDYGKFIINTAGRLVLNFNHTGLLASSDFLFNAMQIDNTEVEEINSTFLSNGTLKGELSFQPLIVKIESLESTFGDGTIMLNSDYYHDKKEKLKIFMEIKNTDISEIYNIWPKEYNKEIRNWFLDNVRDSFIVSSKLNIFSEDMQDYNLDLDLDFVDTNISYYKDLPNLSNASGSILLKESKLNLLINSADVEMPKGGVLNLKDSTLDIPNLSSQTIGSFNLNVNGEIVDSINYLSKFGLGTDKALIFLDNNINGKSIINTQFQIPFFETGSYEDMNINANINIKDLSLKVSENSSLPFLIDSLSSPDVEINIEGNNLSVSSDIFINGVMVKFDVNSNIYGEDNYTYLTAYAELSPTDLETFGINTASYHSGFSRAPVKLEIITKDNSLEEFKVTSDLVTSDLRFPGTDWIKYPGEKANLEVFYDKDSFVGDTKDARVKFVTDKESLEAIIRHDANEIQEFNILNFNNKNIENIQVIGKFDDERSLSLDVMGKSFDVSSFIDKNIFSNTGSESIINIPLINVNIVNMERVIGKESSINNLTGNVVLQYGKLSKTDLIGYFNEGGNVSVKYSVQDEPLPADLGINANNAGEFFKFIGIYTKALSGNMQLRATGPKINNMNGRLFINDFDISRDSTLSALFAATGPSPELSSMENVSFKKLDIDFTLTDGSIRVDRSLLDGPNVRMSFSGPVNQDTGFFKISGNYCPAYEINASFGSIPLFGPLLTGGDGQCLFAVPFVIMRNKYGEDALIKHNNAGLLAPGVFRQFFDY